MKKNDITHVVLVLDASPSMGPYEKDVNQIASNLINHYAKEKVAGEEIRVTVYSFWETAQCLEPCYDMDVLRATSEFSNLYRVGGSWTALRDATALALDDLAMTPEKYGNHDFLVFILTDGMDNASAKVSSSQLSAKLANLPDHWGVQVLMPGEKFKKYARDYGFPDHMIDVWDASKKEGYAEVGKRIIASTDNYLSYRRTTGSRKLKGQSLSRINLADVSMSDVRRDLQPLVEGFDYSFLNVASFDAGKMISKFINEKLGRPYRSGEAFYQHVETEIIQAKKEVVIQDKLTGVVYRGRFDEVRHMLGLPGENVKVNPANHPSYEIYVQSKSVNRKLDPNTRLLIMKR